MIHGQINHTFFIYKACVYYYYYTVGRFRMQDKKGGKGVHKSICTRNGPRFSSTFGPAIRSASLKHYLLFGLVAPWSSVHSLYKASLGRFHSDNIIQLPR